MPGEQAIHMQTICHRESRIRMQINELVERDREMNIDIRSMYFQELEELCKSLGWPRFRAGQIYQWIH